MSYRRAIEAGRCKREKRIYSTEGAALDFLARSRRWAVDMNAYYCGQCRGWHVGHIGRIGKARQR